jgi:hypothetical protein
MATLPRDVSDLYLAPVVLQVDARLDELGRLSVSALSARVALDTNTNARTRDEREAALLAAVEHLVDVHGWTFAWDPRGLRLSHDEHSIVLGVPPTFAAYLAG